MRSSFDAIDILYKQATENAFKSSLALSGNVYKQMRPSGSMLEDVVINSLGMPNRDVQEGILNVNIHVPNLQVKISGNADSSLPNYKRLQDLTTLFIARFDDVYADDIWFGVQQNNLFTDDDGSHYSNIRIAFYAVNTVGHVASVFHPTAPNI